MSDGATDVTLKARSPRTVHLVWLGSAVPARVEHLQSDLAHHDPTVEVRVWGEDDLTWLENHDRFTSERRFPSKADIARYEILLRHGGLYLDADFRVHRALADLFRMVDEDGLVAARQNRVTFSNGLIGAVPGHPLLRRLVAGIEDAYRWTGTMTSPAITGPHYFTEHLVGHLAGGGRCRELPQHEVFPWYADEDPLPVTMRPAATRMSHEWASAGGAWSWNDVSEGPDPRTPQRPTRHRPRGSLRVRAAARPSTHRVVAAIDRFRAGVGLGAPAAPPRTHDGSASTVETWTARRIARSLHGSASFLDLHPESDLPFLAAGRVLDRPGRAIAIRTEEGPTPTAWRDPSMRCSMHLVTVADDGDAIAGVASEGATLLTRPVGRHAPLLGWSRSWTATETRPTVVDLMDSIPRFELVRVDGRRLTAGVATLLETMVRAGRVRRLMVLVDPLSVKPGMDRAISLVGALERGRHVGIGPWIIDGRGRTWTEHLRVAARPFIVDIQG